MTTPAALTGATTTVTVDGVDLHTYGMIVVGVSNPMPDARESTVSIPGRHGDFDFTKRYGGRTITIQGHVISDTHSQLLSNIDSLKKFFRLRDNGDSFKVIFQDQSDRYWTCRYAGGFALDYNSLWMYGRAINFTLNLRCVKPYAESTTLTTELAFLHCLKNKVISYPGTFPVPLQMKLSDRRQVNILEKAGAGGCNESGIYWTMTNGGATDYTGDKVYGSKSVKVTGSGSFPVSAEISATSEIDTSKYYVFAAYTKPITSSTSYLYLDAVITGGATQSVAFDSYSTDTWNFAFLKISPDMLSGASGVSFRLRAQSAVTDFLIDSVFIYEITADEFDDLEYFPPPYLSDPSGDHILPAKNPTIKTFNGFNIYEFLNGDNSGTWVGSTPQIVTDPLGSGDMVFMFASNATVSSPGFYVTGGKIYKCSFKFYVEMGSAARLNVGYVFLTEGSNLSDSALIAAASGGWTDYQQTVTLKKSARAGVFRITPYTIDYKIFIKDLMIVEVASESDPFVSYEKPVISQASLTRTFDYHDEIFIDFDKMIAQDHDYSAKTTVNAMGNLIADRLQLLPGQNTIRYSDSRKTSATPELESCGSIYAQLSYRTRYL